MEAVGERAAYGRHLIAFLAERLTAEFGRGFSERMLRDAGQFYRTYPKWRAVCAELGWAHYRRFMRVKDFEAREFYASECAASNWSERELKRQIDTNLYERTSMQPSTLPICRRRRSSSMCSGVSARNTNVVLRMN